uniref:Uncharacterized protein n=2 Tax=Kalanchoe fedtschenkoi TaxID=63787 RepID=A0A7N1A5K4_KALFE
MSSSSASSFSPDHHTLHHTPSLSDQLCYVHCNLCDTVLAVSVPGSCLFKTVTVRCGHCTNLLSVNMRGLLLPPAAPPPHRHATNFFNNPHNLMAMEEMQTNMTLMNQLPNPNEQMMMMPLQTEFMPAPPAVRPPEKRQRVPSAYNRFIKEEIQRIKAENPDISHREAFSAAAKNWAHFPHIHFGLLPDQPVRRSGSNLLPQRRGAAEGRLLMTDGFLQ